MFTHKPLKCGFVILCPDRAVGLLKTTANSIISRYTDVPYTCVTDSSATDDDIKEMKKICPTYKGKSTFSSLINVGMRYAPSEWNFLVCAGATVRWKLNDRFSYFIESEKDILFPIADGKTNFVEGTLNGLMIHRNTWKEVGEMADEGPMDEVKTLWAYEAICKGVKFKAISNAKFC